jgi:membrane-associated HD superfamily phosphohydrolase
MKLNKISYNLIVSGIIATFLMVMYLIFEKIQIATHVIRFMCISIYVIKCVFMFGILFFRSIRVKEWENVITLSKNNIFVYAIHNILWIDVFGGMLNLRPPKQG